MNSLATQRCWVWLWLCVLALGVIGVQAQPAATPQTMGRGPTTGQPALPTTPGLQRETARIKQLQDAVSRAERTRGRQSIETAEALHELSRELRRLKRFKEAEAVQQNVLAITRALYGAEHHSTAAAMYGLAQVYESMGRLTEAESLFERSLAIIKARLGAQHENVGVVLQSMGNLYSSLGDSQRAIDLYVEAYRIFRARYGAKSLEAATWKRCEAVTPGKSP